MLHIYLFLLSFYYNDLCAKNNYNSLERVTFPKLMLHKIGFSTQYFK